jgi:microcystin-dependent protein
MIDVFVGEILFFPFNFPPVGYAFCQGQLLSISQNTALFSLLGTTYGGDGKTNFALPNLQAKVPMGFGQGPGLSDRFQGETGGAATITLSPAQMPQHTHAMRPTVACRSGAGNQQTPVNNVPATESVGVTALFSNATPNSTMRAGNIVFTGTPTAASAGGGQPHENRQPYLTINYCIALQGVFPARS